LVKNPKSRRRNAASTVQNNDNIFCLKNILKFLFKKKEFSRHIKTQTLTTCIDKRLTIFEEPKKLEIDLQ